MSLFVIDMNLNLSVTIISPMINMIKLHYERNIEHLYKLIRSPSILITIKTSETVNEMQELPLTRRKLHKMIP